MRWLRAASAVLPLIAAPLLLAAGWLVFDNPTIDEGRDGAHTYTCLAPYDTVLNDASNIPGGEPPINADSIASKCRKAGRQRFDVAVGLGAAGAGCLAAWPVLAALGRWRTRRGAVCAEV